MDAKPDRLIRGSAAPSAEAFWWSAGWLSLVAGGAAFVLASGPLGHALLLALAGGPALVDLVLHLAQRRFDPRLRLVVWTVGPGLAMLLSGGALGPVGVWCLAPLAASLMAGRPRSAATAGALALALLGLGLVVSLLGGGGGVTATTTRAGCRL